MKSLRFSILLLAGLAACGDNIDETPERGDLGRGKFLYECLGETDVACASGNAVFPQVIAVGSRFGMRFAIDQGAQPTVIAGTSTFLEPVTGGFRVVRPGHLSLLAVTGNREVIDIKHVRSERIDEVRVQRADELPEPQLRLRPGDTVELTAVPYDLHGGQLAGALEYAWTSEDPSVVRIDTLSELNRIRISALTEGETALHITVADEMYAVPVISGEQNELDSGVFDPDAGEDAGTDGGMTDGGVDASAEGGDT